MPGKRISVTAALLVYLATLAVVCGPMRWELAHTYEHIVSGTEGNLPLLTEYIALPILGIGSHGAAVGFLVFLIWSILWLPVVVLLVGTWRIRSEKMLDDCLLYGGFLYLSATLLISVVVIISFLLPFALL